MRNGFAAEIAWQDHLIEDTEGIRRVLDYTRRIAVLGIKTEESGEPAFFVPEFARDSGYEIVPVPVYYPDVTHILGAPVYRTLAAIPGGIDMVNVFRRSHDIPAHLDDILSAQPRCVWFQAGIRNAVVAEELARNGVDVVQNRCLLTEIRRRPR